MKRCLLLDTKQISISVLVLFFLSLGLTQLKAEGSADFINYPGMRLFLWPQETHQLKVYAQEGEFINVGASHVGITGGFISVYRPDGTLHTTFDDSGATAGMAIINNDVEETVGPTGGGTSAGQGYQPGVVSVAAGEAGVWTVMMEFPTYNGGTFPNLANNAPWSRAANQPLIQRVILAWDITISKEAAGNEGGILTKGRVFANKFASMVSENGNTTSPTYYVLTKEGFIYQIDCDQIDPYGFPLFSNTTGIVNGTQTPLYKSFDKAAVEVSNDVAAWNAGNKYLFDPMAQDNSVFINNKIFFNIPDPSMPAMAMVTDVINSETADTWLYSEPTENSAVLADFKFIGENTTEDPCQENTMLPGMGGFVHFTSNVGGTAKLQLDLNNDGDYIDSKDRTVYQPINVGESSIYWDGMDGEGNPIAETILFDFGYQVEVRGGETHILMSDIENNMGGINFRRLNGPNSPSSAYFFDHSEYDGSAVSGGGAPGKATETEDTFTYDANWGNNKILDYWAYVPFDGGGQGSFSVNITEDCTKAPVADTDGDGIIDMEDIDDDNDGILDALEYCNPDGSWACLPNMLDPSHDTDNDRIPNYADADDAAVGNVCEDADGDGICDKIPAVYDTDGDQVPDHLDLDSDNDGISDVVEISLAHLDADQDGILDGGRTAFGANGFFNDIATDPNSFEAQPTYTRWDVDTDGVPDHDDLDSDNDGINDVTEAGFGFSDSNNDGRIDDGTGAIPMVSAWGLAPIIDPTITGVGIPFPVDFDADMVPDWHDLDSDNDGINDVIEGGHSDMDNDAYVGVGMPVVDANGKVTMDAMGTPFMTTSLPPDVDSDMVPDWHDLDSDNDGINDVAEAGLTDSDNDGIIGVATPIVDENGLATADSQMTPVMTTSILIDQDMDEVPDWHDLDSDNDGINDVIESGHTDPDNDGLIGTGLPVVNPNGQATASPDGTPLSTTSTLDDTDGDGIPDWHDLDSDNDGINDVLEGGNTDPDDDGIIGAGEPDINEMGQGTADEAGTPLNPTSDPLDTDEDGIPDYLDLDADNDGLLDVIEAGLPDPDNDGIVGVGSPDVNPNGQTTNDATGNPINPTSNPIDFDEDGIPDFQDIDSDGDGINDIDECANGGNCPDTDGDGMPDWHDLDSDDDGVLDAEECVGGSPCPDSDGNNIPDVLEYSCSDLTIPQITGLAGSGTFCEGAEVLLMANNSVANMPGVSTVNYVWTGPNNFNYSEVTPNIMGDFSVMIPNVTPTQTGTYTLTLITDKGCESDNLSVIVDVNPRPEAPSLDVDHDILCVNDVLELNSSIYTGEEVTYSWYFGDGNTSEAIAQTDIPTLFLDNIQPAQEGIYSVSVELDGCGSLMSNAHDIEVFDATKLDAQTDSFVTEFDNPIDFEQTELTINDVFGTDDLNNFTITVQEEPQHGELFINSDGSYTYVPNYHFLGDDQFEYELCSTVCPEICETTDVLLRVEERAEWGDCYIPNLVTPNNDGANDVLFIPCAVDNPDNEIHVFNRWGDKVYSTEGYANNWEGTYNNQTLPAGTYFFVFKKDKNEQDAVKGYFTLLR